MTVLTCASVARRRETVTLGVNYSNILPFSMGKWLSG